MSTSGVVTIHDEYGDEPICAIMSQADGYPSGFGEDLRQIVSQYTIGNGISYNDPKPYANGMECLAAFVVKALKDRAGGIYMVKVGHAYEYNYHIRFEARPDAGNKQYGVAKVTCDEEPEW